MNDLRIALIALLAGLAFGGATGVAQERDRVRGDFQRADRDGDGRLDRAEWRRRGNFDRLDADADGTLSLPEVRAMYAGHAERAYDWPPPGFSRSAPEPDPTVANDRVDVGALGRATLCGIGRGRKCDPQAAVDRGLLETGLGPVFPDDAVCHGIDDTLALDYGFKRDQVAYHGGIDLPAPWGTPMIAAAAGSVVGTFRGERSARGIEVVIRHAPEDTGLPIWIYTGYGHLDRMPELEVGQRVRLGEVIGPTGNSGVSGRQRKRSNTRRPAIHFSAFFSETGAYTVRRDVVIPANGHWLDPVALYRQAMPVDSQALKALPEGEKDVAVAVMFEDGTVSPAGARFVWPYMCERR